MNFLCQQECLTQLKKLSDSDRHSVLIEGVGGSGKTYLAQQYTNMLNISDFILVEPKVNEIRDAIDSCMSIENNVLLCIENLDKGVVGASYTLLKCLEEPASHVYIVITCTSVQSVPDTIVSRSAVITTSPPVDSDLAAYAKSMNMDKYLEVKDLTLWKCARTFRDVDTILNLNLDQISYFMSLPKLSKFNEPVSSIVWKLGHYDNQQEAPCELIIRYIMEICNSKHIRRQGIECIRSLNTGRIAQHAILAKFAFECKYCE